MNTYTFKFMTQTTDGKIKPRIIIKHHHNFNSALLFDGMIHTSATTDLECDRNVVTYMLLSYKIVHEDGRIDKKTVNDPRSFQTR